MKSYPRTQTGTTPMPGERPAKEFNLALAEQWLAYFSGATHYSGGDIECDKEDMDEVLLPAVRLAVSQPLDERGLCRNCGWKPGDSYFVP